MSAHTVLADACSQPGIVILRRPHLKGNAAALSACSMSRKSTTCTLCFLHACLLACPPPPLSTYLSVYRVQSQTCVVQDGTWLDVF
mmetsp:Transcript_29763/g.75390  ORF Transcript_29763/g.75390 Transcript_29763/m.75390 type:complete len:86 (-) Transcript_29763:20-277(-)